MSQIYCARFQPLLSFGLGPDSPNGRVTPDQMLGYLRGPQASGLRRILGEAVIRGNDAKARQVVAAIIRHYYSPSPAGKSNDANRTAKIEALANELAGRNATMRGQLIALLPTTFHDIARIERD